MKKWGLFFVLFLLLPLVVAELTDNDLLKIQSVVKSEVDRSNDKLRDEIKIDIEEVRDEVNVVLEDISGASSTTKTFLALSIAGIVIVAETFISFLKFLIWRLKRKLKPKVEEPVKKPEIKKLKLHKPEKKPVEKPKKPEIKKLKLKKPETKLDKEKRKLEKLREKIKKKQDMKKLKEEMRQLKKRG